MRLDRSSSGVAFSVLILAGGALAALAATGRHEPPGESPVTEIRLAPADPVEAGPLPGRAPRSRATGRRESRRAPPAGRGESEGIRPAPSFADDFGRCRRALYGHPWPEGGPEHAQGLAVLAELAGGGGDSLAVLVLLLASRDENVRCGARAAFRTRFGGDGAGLSALVGLTRHRSWRVRGAALRVLARTRTWSPEALPAFLAALDDPNGGVRKTALGALEEIPVGASEAVTAVLAASDLELIVYRLSLLGPKAAPAIPLLLGLLGDADARYGAMEVLEYIGPAAAKAVPALAVIAGDPDVSDAHQAVLALGSIGDPRAIPALVHALGSDDDDIRSAALEGLGAIGRPADRAVPAILAAYAEEPEEVIEVLGQIGGERALRALIGLLRDAEGEWCDEAVWALDTLGPAAAPAVPGLREMIRDRDRVAEPVADALASIGGPEAVRVLVEALTEKRQESEEAIRALGLIGPEAREAMPLLRAALTTDAQWWALIAIGRIGGPDAAAILARHLSHEDDEMRIEAARGLARLGAAADGSVPGLLRMLREDGDSWVRGEAARAVGLIGTGGPTAVRALIDALGDVEGHVRLAAARALAAHGRDAAPARSALAKAARDESIVVRLAASEALGRLGDRVEPILLDGLDDQVDEVRIVAARALGNLGLRTDLAILTLLDLFANGSADMRQEAAEALGEFAPRSVIPALEASLARWYDEIRLATRDALRRIRAR